MNSSNSVESYPITSIVCDIFIDAIRSAYDLQGFVRVPQGSYVVQSFGREIGVCITEDAMSLVEL